MNLLLLDQPPFLHSSPMLSLQGLPANARQILAAMAALSDQLSGMVYAAKNTLRPRPGRCQALD